MAKGIKTGGRKKGTPNKITNSIRKTLAEVLNDYTAESLRDDLNSLTPFERVKVAASLFRFTLPPMKQQETEDSRDFEPVTIRVINLGSGKNDCNV